MKTDVSHSRILALNETLGQVAADLSAFFFSS